jgi:mRNA interferase MazF
MLTSGDVIELDLGVPEGREAGFRHPAIVVTAQRILDARPNVIQVVPLTSTVRGFAAEVTIEPDRDNGLQTTSVAQCQHVRAVSTRRVNRVIGNIGPAAATQIRDTLGLILDIPG